MSQRIAFNETPKGYFDGLFKTGAYLKKLDQKLMGLVYTRVSQINGCGFCLDMHYKEAIHLGETEQRLYSLPAWRECPYYTEKERAVLAYAEAITANHVDDEVFSELSSFYTKEEVADLTLAIVTVNTWNRLNEAFRTLPGTYKIGQFA
jgi:AhpD family alkylhydroperoxidase